MISAVIVSFNQGKKLNNCLKSIDDFADEIIVVDLGSIDSSMQIAKKFNAKIYHHKFVPFVELVRNYAISKADGNWILVLDPDEEVSDGLKAKLREVARDNKFAALNIPRKNIFFGRFIKHTNWWPDYHVRFFQKGHVEWTGDIHSYPKVSGNILKLEARESLAIIHHGYESVKQFLDRQNRYSEIESQQRFGRGERFSYFNFFWWPTREFLKRFIKHAGFMDGFYGFALTFLMIVQRLMVAIKLWEFNKK